MGKGNNSMIQRIILVTATALVALGGLKSANAASPEEAPATSTASGSHDGQVTVEQARFAEALSQLTPYIDTVTQRQLVDLLAKATLNTSKDKEVLVYTMYEDPPAYFERAPSGMSARMRLTIDAACKGDAAKAIFCADIQIWYLREISELGDKTMGGYACTGVYARNKYFSSLSIFSNSSCVSMACLKGEDLCRVSTEDLLAATHAYSPTKLPKRR
jgi:hypothetical protein